MIPLGHHLNRLGRTISMAGLLLLIPACQMTRGPKFDPRAESESGPGSKPADGADSRFVTVPAENPAPELLKPKQDEFVLGPGDKMEIEVLNEENSRAVTTVTPDGMLYYSLLSGMEVQGKTVPVVKAELEKALTAYYRRPQVSIILTEANSQRIWVLGRLNGPGIYTLRRPTRVLDAISMAGGLITAAFTGTTEELADLEHSFLKRNGKLMPVNFQKLVRDGDLSHNIYLEPNDFIYLPSALTNEIYVMGAVNSPRPVGFMNEMNVMAALGRAFGARPGADLSHVTIIRGSLTEPKSCVVNVNDIMRGKATNIRLQPGDIVYVPTPDQISAGNLIKQAMNSFVSSIGVREGGNAVGADANLSLTLDGGTAVNTTPAPTRR